MNEVELAAFRGELELLGKGGQGTAYAVRNFRLPNAPFQLVYKAFHKPNNATDEAALRALGRARASMPTHDRSIIDDRTSWPLALVRDGQLITGFLMRRVSRDFRYRRNSDNRE